MTPPGSGGRRRHEARVEADFLSRIEQTAVGVVACATAAGAVLGGLTWAGGILGGGLLAAVSYWAIRSSVDALTGLIGEAAAPATGEAGGGGDGARPVPRVPAWRLAASVLGRHALLAALAYVIIARLRLHPLGVLVGASAVVLAATREAFRVARPGPRS